MNELNQNEKFTHTHTKKEKERERDKTKKFFPTIYSITNIVIIIIHLYRVILPNVFNQINASLAGGSS